MGNPKWTGKAGPTTTGANVVKTRQEDVTAYTPMKQADGTKQVSKEEGESAFSVLPRMVYDETANCIS